MTYVISDKKNTIDVFSLVFIFIRINFNILVWGF